MSFPKVVALHQTATEAKEAHTLRQVVHVYEIEGAIGNQEAAAVNGSIVRINILHCESLTLLWSFQLG